MESYNAASLTDSNFSRNIVTSWNKLGLSCAINGVIIKLSSKRDVISSYSHRNTYEMPKLVVWWS